MADDFITPLTEEQRKTLVSKTSKALPDNPSERGYSADQIKRKQGYEASLYLYDLIQAAIAEANEHFSEFDASSLATFAKLSGGNEFDGTNTFETIVSSLATFSDATVGTLKVTGSSEFDEMATFKKGLGVEGGQRLIFNLGAMVEVRNGLGASYGTKYNFPYYGNNYFEVASEAYARNRANEVRASLEIEEQRRASAITALNTTIAANKALAEAALAVKADLVGGKVPASQLPDRVDEIIDLPFFIVPTESEQRNPHEISPGSGPNQAFTYYTKFVADLNAKQHKFSESVFYFKNKKAEFLLALPKQYQYSQGYYGSVHIAQAIVNDCLYVRVPFNFWPDNTNHVIKVDVSALVALGITNAYSSDSLIIKCEIYADADKSWSTSTYGNPIVKAVAIQEYTKSTIFMDYESNGTTHIYRSDFAPNFIEITSSLSLGETSSTAFAGNRGVALETAVTALQSGKADLENGELRPSQIPAQLRKIKTIAMPGANGKTNPVTWGTIIISKTYFTTHTGTQFYQWLVNSCDGRMTNFTQFLVWVEQNTVTNHLVTKPYLFVYSTQTYTLTPLDDNALMALDDGVAKIEPFYTKILASGTTVGADYAVYDTSLLNYKMVATKLELGEGSSNAFAGNRGKAVEDAIADLQSNKADLVNGVVPSSQLPGTMDPMVTYKGTFLNPDGPCPIVDVSDYSLSFFTNAKIAELFPDCVDEDTDQIPYISIFLVYVSDNVVTSVGGYGRVNVTPKMLWHNRSYNTTYEFRYDGTSIPPTAINPFFSGSALDYQRFSTNTMIMCTSENPLQPNAGPNVTYRFLGYATKFTNPSGSSAPTAVQKAVMAVISQSLSLGESSSSAFPGNRGKTLETTVTSLGSALTGALNDIDDNAAAITAEATARANADSSLSARIDTIVDTTIPAEASARVAGIAAEAALRVQGDADTLAAAKAYADAIQSSSGTVSGAWSFTDHVTFANGATIGGTVTYVESTDIAIKDLNFELAKDNSAAIASIAGFHVVKYNGTDVGGIGFDASGYAYVGDMTKDGSTGVITRGDAQEIATRKDHGQWSSNEIPVWDSTTHCYKPGGSTIAALVADYEAKIASAQSVLYLHDHGDGTLDLMTTAGVSGLSIVAGDDGYLKLVYGN